MISWHLVLAALCGTLLLGVGCASQQAQPATVDYRGIERPARPISEEESTGYEAGQIVIVLVAVAVAGALIALPFLFLTGTL